MEYRLKNGKSVVIKKPVVEDADGIINLISTADMETKFLARNPGEFSITPDQEKIFIKNVLDDNDTEWFTVKIDGKIIGQCSVGLVSKNERYRHRAEVSFVVLKDYWNLGIGKKLMELCIEWCKEKNVTQIELRVVSDNERAINFYEKFGFKTTGKIPDAMYYPDGIFADEQIMVLKL